MSKFDEWTSGLGIDLDAARKKAGAWVDEKEKELKADAAKVEKWVDDKKKAVGDDIDKGKKWVADKVDEGKKAVAEKVDEGKKAVAQKIDNAKKTVLGDESGKSVPRPMEPDCKPQSGKVPGPKNHIYCGTHGHVLDTGAKMIIATSVADYVKRGLAKVVAAVENEGKKVVQTVEDEGKKALGNVKKTAFGDETGGKLPRPMQGDCKPQKGKVPGPANHVYCATHGHVLDVDAKMIIAASIASYVKGEIAALGNKIEDAAGGKGGLANDAGGGGKPGGAPKEEDGKLKIAGFDVGGAIDADIALKKPLEFEIGSWLKGGFTPYVNIKGQIGEGTVISAAVAKDVKKPVDLGVKIGTEWWSTKGEKEFLGVTFKDPKVDVEGSLTKTGLVGKVSFTGTTRVTTIQIAIEVAIYKKEAGLETKFGTVTPSVQGEAIKIDGKDVPYLRDNPKLRLANLTISVGGKCELEPNWKKIILRKVLEKAGEEVVEKALENAVRSAGAAITFEGLIAVGFIANGAMIAVGGIYAIVKAAEARALYNEATAIVEAGAAAFRAGFLGKTAPNGPGASDSHAQGKRVLQEALAAVKKKFPDMSDDEILSYRNERDAEYYTGQYYSEYEWRVKEQVWTKFAEAHKDDFFDADRTLKAGWRNLWGSQRKESDELLKKYLSK